MLGCQSPAAEVGPACHSHTGSCPQVPRKKGVIQGEVAYIIHGVCLLGLWIDQRAVMAVWLGHLGNAVFIVPSALGNQQVAANVGGVLIWCHVGMVYFLSAYTLPGVQSREDLIGMKVIPFIPGGLLGKLSGID